MLIIHTDLNSDVVDLILVKIREVPSKSSIATGRTCDNIVLVLVKLVVIGAKVNVNVLHPHLAGPDSLSLKIRIADRAFILLIKEIILFVNKLKLPLGFFLLDLDLFLPGVLKKLLVLYITKS